MASKKFGIAATVLFLGVSAYSVYEWVTNRKVVTDLPQVSVRREKTSAPLDPFAKAVGASVPVSMATQDQSPKPGVGPAEPSRTETSEESSSRIEAFAEPYRNISVSVSEMGSLEKIHVKEGDVVKAGDIIAVMNDDVLRASLDIARRSMAAEGALKSALADIGMKKSELIKLQELRERNHASQQEVDRINTELEVAEARLQSVREDLEVKTLEAKRIESQLELRVIRAPIDGVITDLSHDAGEYVSPTDPNIARLVQLDSLMVVFSVPLAQRNAVKANDTVMLHIGSADVPAEGVVEFVSPTPDSSNSSVRVKVRLPNADGRFQSGESVRLDLKQLIPTQSNEVATGESSTSIANGSHETPARQ
jgi:RND family efflux transporter MFP subunit